VLGRTTAVSPYALLHGIRRRGVGTVTASFVLSFVPLSGAHIIFA